MSPLAKVVTFLSKGSKSDFAKTEHLPSGVKCSQLCEFSLESLEIFFQVIKKVFWCWKNFCGLFHVSICSKSEPDPRDRAKISRFPVLIDALPNVGSQFWMHQMKGEMRTFRFRYSVTVKGAHNPLPQYRYCSDFEQNPPWNSISVSGRI